MAVASASANVEGWRQLGELALAFVLSASIGLEREIHQKSAGLRTHTLVGLGAATFMLVSKYGFTDVLVPGRVIVDPSRMAAQIVSGVGFLGAGLIFVRQGSVRGLTTAAAVWATAAVGAAAGAGLPLLAVAAVAVYFLVVLAFPWLTRRLPRSASASSVIRVRYQDGRGLLREVLRRATLSGFLVAEVAAQSIGFDPAPGGVAQEWGQGTKMVEVVLELQGKGSVNELAATLLEVEGVAAVLADDANDAA